MILIDLAHGLVTWWLSSSLNKSYQGVHCIRLLGFKFMISWCKEKTSAKLDGTFRVHS